MNQTVTKTALLISILALGACSAAWGRSFTMVDSTPDYVKFKYWLASVDEGGMNKEARDYCAVYQKDAVLANRESADGGHEELVNTYVCTQAIIYAPAIPEETR